MQRILIVVDISSILITLGTQIKIKAFITSVLFSRYWSYLAYAAGVMPQNSLKLQTMVRLMPFD